MGQKFHKGGGSGDFEPAPEGVWPAVCADVVFLGVVAKPWGEQDTVRLIWFLDPSLVDSKGRPFRVQCDYKNSLHEKAKLCMHLQSWANKRMTDAARANFDSDTLVGKNCQLQIIHNLGDSGSRWANVQAVLPALRNGPHLRVPEDYVRVKDRPENQAAAPSSDQDWSPPSDDDVPF